MKHYKSVAFLSISRVSSPPAQTQSPPGETQRPSIQIFLVTVLVAIRPEFPGHVRNFGAKICIQK